MSKKRKKKHFSGRKKKGFREVSKLPSRIFFVVNVSRRRGGVTEECWIQGKEEREEWKDEEEVNEESDASGRLSLAPDVQMCTHVHRR